MKETNNNVKGLKKQLAAAVAMVCVAAVALGSSTYAWFVSNNKVTATTTNISAQSNSAYLVIDNAAKGKQIQVPHHLLLQAKLSHQTQNCTRQQ